MPHRMGHNWWDELTEEELAPLVDAHETPIPSPSDDGGGGGGGGGGGEPFMTDDQYYQWLNQFYGGGTSQFGEYWIDPQSGGQVYGLDANIGGPLWGGMGTEELQNDPLYSEAYRILQSSGGEGNLGSNASALLSYMATGDIQYESGAQDFASFYEQSRARNEGNQGIVEYAGGGGGGASPSKAKFTVNSDIRFADQPEWWQAMLPDTNNPISNYQTLSNLLIPLLSPEDQRTVATNLYQSDPEQFALYDPTGLGAPSIPGEITGEIRNQFFTGERANKALGAFDQLLSISGKTEEDFGPGFSFLKSVADQVGSFKLTSGATQLTETQQGQLLAGLDPLLAQTNSDQLRAFGPLARSFANPFFSAGSLTGTTKNRFGDMIRPGNPRYY